MTSAQRHGLGSRAAGHRCILQGLLCCAVASLHFGCQFPSYVFAGSAGGGGGGGSAGALPPGGSDVGGAAGGAGSSSQPLFADDFESGTAAQWLTIAGSAWSVGPGSTTQSQVYRQSPVFSNFYAAIAKVGPWADQIIEARVMVTKFGGSHTTDVAAIYGRFSDIDNYYAAVLRPDGKVSIRARVAGSGPTSLQTSADIGVVEGVWYNLRFSLVGSTLTLFVDGQFRAGVVDFSIGSGTVGLGGDDTAAEFDDVRVTQP